MERPQKYYNMQIDKENKIADVTIFGEITSWPWLESDVSSYKLSKRLEELKGVEQINVHINSYGGEVAEGWAIYNSLINHPAKITTIVEGFACSIASVIFMAGEKRIMNDASVLMIHNVLSYVCGNFNDMRKQADDLEKLNNLSKKTYLKYISISDEELQKMMNEETLLTPEECVQMGFATEIKKEEQKKYSQSARRTLMKKIFSNNSQSQTIVKNEESSDDMKKYECEECGYVHEGELPEYFVCPECGASKDSFIEMDTTEVSEDNNLTNDNENSNEDNNQDENDDNANQKAYHFFNSIANERGEN